MTHWVVLIMKTSQHFVWWIHVHDNTLDCKRQNCIQILKTQVVVQYLVQDRKKKPVFICFIALIKLDWLIATLALTKIWFTLHSPIPKKHSCERWQVGLKWKPPTEEMRWFESRFQWKLLVLIHSFWLTTGRFEIENRLIRKLIISSGALSLYKSIYLFIWYVRKLFFWSGALCFYYSICHFSFFN